MVDRRSTLIALCAAAVAVAGRSFAQQTKAWRIGFLTSHPRPDSLDNGVSGAFQQGMRDLGYVQGKHVQYEWRFTNGKFEPLAELAAELVRLKVDIIVTIGTPATRAAQKATKAIPIVMIFTGDPVGTGLVASLARPGGNTTGISNLNVDMNAKRVELLITMLPKIARVGALLNSANPTYAANLAGLQAGAQKTGITLLPAQARTPDEIERAFSTMKQQNAEAVIVHLDSFFVAQARQIADLAAGLRLPLIGPLELVDFGALMSYAPNVLSQCQRASVYVDRILRGAKPADLPVEQPTKLDLVLNLKAAKALGISIPREVMLLSDQVIQ